MSRDYKCAGLLLCLVVGFAPETPAVECFTPLQWQPKLTGSPGDADGNFIQDTLDALTPGEAATVIADLNRCPEDADVARLGQFGTVEVVGKFLSLVILRDVAVEDLSALAGDDQVAFVEEWSEITLDLDISRQVIGADQIVADYGYDGSGVNVAVIDTGAEDTVHQSLLGSFLYGIDCTLSPPACVPFVNPTDFSFHGTKAASIVLGRGGGDCLDCIGIAPGANLIDVKYYGVGAGNISTVITAVQTILEYREIMEPHIINASFSNCADSDGSDAMSQIANWAVERGIIWVGSAGNTTSCPSSWNLPFNANLVGAPAAADRIITVGNSWDKDTVDRSDDVISATSLTGPRLDDGDGETSDEQKPELAAPGSGILAATTTSPTAYSLGNGTSWSAPHVAGCAALVLEARPGMSPASMKQLLISTAEDKGAAGWDGFWGHGLLDCHAAIQTVEDTPRTDLRFDVWDCRPGLNPPCWQSPDVYTTDATIQEGEPNVLEAVIRNAGPNPSENFSVKLGVHDFGNGDGNYDVCTVDEPSLPVNGTTTVSCPFTPGLSGIVPAIVHASLKAEIVYPFDLDFTNDRAMRNVNIQQNFFLFVFAAKVVNPTNESMSMQLQERPLCCAAGEVPDVDGCPCEGWDLRKSDDNFTMEANDCPRAITLEMEAIDPDAPRDAMFDVQVVGTDAAGEGTTLNGFSVGARLDCSVAGVLWSDAETMSWQPSEFTACGALFDVVRGPLPIVDGDFSAAECFEDDDGDLLATDPAVPAAGTGFYYLVRTGGPDPGIWSLGGVAVDRDLGLTACS